MRTIFIKTLEEMARKDKRIFLLTADLGFSIFEQFKKSLQSQYLNAGIAEQNMTGVSAGMAIEGKIPFLYSIVPFCTMRNFEQIRNDICYQKLNVKIVGVGAGFSYGPYGHTHHGLEDIGILRTLPGLTIFCPGDPKEAEFVTKEAAKINGPVYIRIARGGESMIHSLGTKFTVGNGNVVKEGKDICIITTGNMLGSGMDVVKNLQKRNISVKLVSMHTIKPLDKKLIANLAKEVKAIFTLEEHSVIGGLGSAVAEVLAENSISVTFRRIGVGDQFTKEIGSQEFMRKTNGLSHEKISSYILNIFNTLVKTR